MLKWNQNYYLQRVEASRIKQKHPTNNQEGSQWEANRYLLTLGSSTQTSLGTLKALPQCYVQNEKEKKRQYNDRILQTDLGSFTLFVFSIYGGKGREGSTFYTWLSNLFLKKEALHNL